ncbi:MAG: DnaK suppressor protein [Hyphomicrobiaceae bacterium]|jgi:DnaK suppressor protein
MSKSLSAANQEMFERLLNTEKRRLTSDAARTVEDMGGQPDAFADPSDRAAWESDSTRDLRIRDRERKLLDKVDEAIKRLEDGTFGECQECGEMITVGRLRARPVTTLCIECKAQQETAEGRPNSRTA